MSGVDVTHNSDGIVKFLEKIAMCSYSDDEEVLESRKCLWKCPLACFGLQKMVDICIVIVDIICFCDLDLFSDGSDGPTKMME